MARSFLTCSACVAVTALAVQQSADAPAAPVRARSRTLPELTIYVRHVAKQGIYRFRADGRPVGWIARQIGSQTEASCWSPDGHAIAFTNVGRRLALVDTRTGGARALPVGRGWSCYSWSPDGRFLLAVAPPAFCLPAQPHQPRVVCDDVARRLMLIPVGGGKPRTLSFGRSGGVRSPVWSPNSSRLAFVRLSHFVAYPGQGQSRGRPFVLTFGNPRPPRPLGRHGLLTSALSWAPNGRMLLLASGTSGYPTANGSLAMLDVAGGGVVSLGRGHDAVWSRTGALAWVCRAAICIRSAHGGTVARVLAPRGWRVRHRDGGYDDLAWSPDGTRLVFEASRGAEASRLFVTGRDGRIVRYLYAADRNPQQAGPAWSPDGRFIAFWSGLFRDQSAIYIIRLGAAHATLVPAYDSTHYDFEDGFFWRPAAARRGR
jgi:dipeptidyl aminopeptidase/acylaminoacyl peptidase